MDWENHLEKKSDQKIEKTAIYKKIKSDPKNQKALKVKVKLQHVNKKIQARKRIFVQTPFSHSAI